MPAYFRIAPGIKLSARRSGIGIGIGPRAFRLWFGGGGLKGISTGVGPFVFYKSLAGGGGSTTRSAYRQSPPASRGPSPASLARVARFQDAARRLEEFRRELRLHAQDFPPAQRPVAPPPAPVEVAYLEDYYRKQLLHGVGLLDFGARRRAKKQAQDLARAEAIRETERRRQAQVQFQAELDQWWQRLLDNDPPVVLGTLEAAFSDNLSPAVAVDCEGASVTVVVVLEGIDEVPEEIPDTTPTGRPTVRRLSKTERNELYLQWMASNVLATVKEVLAVCPGLKEVAVAVIRKAGTDPFGEPILEPVYAGTFSRDLCSRIDWTRPEARDAIHYADDVKIVLKGKAKQLVPLEPEVVPGLDDILGEVKRALTEPPEDDEPSTGGDK